MSNKVDKIKEDFNQLVRLMEFMGEHAFAFPALLYPESLLPCSKEKAEHIVSVYEVMLKDKGETSEALLTLKSFLNKFIDDREAIKSNNHMVVKITKESN
jgi:hypothetical protein